jgi:hypothetical protein
MEVLIRRGGRTRIHPGRDAGMESPDVLATCHFAVEALNLGPLIG